MRFIARLVASVLCAVAAANALLLSSCVPKSDCIELAVQSLLLTTSGLQTVNLTSNYEISCTGGGAAWLPTTEACDGAQKGTVFVWRQASLACSFARNTTAEQTLLQLAFLFQDSALYFANGTVGCGAVSAALTNISLTGHINTTNISAPVTVPAGSLHAAANTSFYCPDTTLSFMVNTTGSLALAGVRAQAFMPNSTFAPGDANAACSATPAADNSSTQSGAGLIVGGIISALAFIGILAFAYSKCRAKSNYELVNNH